MRWIEFSADVVYETEGRLKGPNFRKGERVELRDDLADRWVRRGLAEYVEGAAARRRPEPVQRQRLAGAKDVEIVGDWSRLPSREMVELANALVEPAVRTRNEAIDAIEAELTARAAS